MMHVGVTIGLAAALATAGQARTPVARDVEGYAVAACLAQQSSAYLRAQGEGWASLIVQRGAGSPDALRGVTAAVRAELSRRPVYRIEDEGHPGAAGQALPVAYCAEIVDRPAVRAAVTRAEAALAGTYRLHEYKRSD